MSPPVPEGMPARYISTYKCLIGWKALEVWWNPEGFWEPWQTAGFAHEDEQGAIADARDWAAAEDKPYLPRES